MAITIHVHEQLSQFDANTEKELNAHLQRAYLLLQKHFFPAMFKNTVEPHHTTTPLIRPPRYYGHFFVARTKAFSFSYLKTLLIRPPSYYDQRPPFGVPSCYFLYKITLCETSE